jgi:hypothetical protein
MKLLNLLFAATALSLAATPAFAVNWVFVTYSGKIAYEVDVSSIKQLGPDVKRAWTRFSLKNEIRKPLSLEEFNCRLEAKKRNTYSAIENGVGLEGSPVQNKYDDWRPVAPGTVGQIMLQFA